MPRTTIWKVAIAVTAAIAAFFWFFFAIGTHWIGNLVLAVIFTALAALLWWRFASHTARALSITPDGGFELAPKA